MNATSSDDLVNFMAAPTTRRQALKALTATTVAAPLALSSIGTALASPKLPQASEQVHAASGKAEDIIAIAQEAMKQNDLQAVILSVSIGNKNIVTTALGQSMTGVPATTQMHFRLGAVAIVYLTTLLLRLVDQRRVRLDDRLSTWLPSLPHAERITLRMLPENRSDYADYVPLLATAFDANPFRAWSQQELLQPALAQPLQNPPGQGFTYAHTNFVILGMALQKITGKPVATLMQDNILSPLGLHETASSSTAEIRPPVLHAFDSERGIYEESTFWNPSWINNSWVLQNPLFSGYNALMAYLPSKKIAIAVTTTLGPKSSSSTNYSSQIFKSIGTYLAPDHPPV